MRQFEGASEVAQIAIWSVLPAIEIAASDNGKTSTSKRAIVMTTTADVRLPHNVAWIQRMIGQVAITIIVAQMAAGRNGQTTQNEARIRAPIKSTARVVRVRSRLISVTALFQWMKDQTEARRFTPAPRSANGFRWSE
jgi:hypothetical protein